MELLTRVSGRKIRNMAKECYKDQMARYLVGNSSMIKNRGKELKPIKTGRNMKVCGKKI